MGVCGRARAFFFADGVLVGLEGRRLPAPRVSQAATKTSRGGRGVVEEQQQVLEHQLVSVGAFTLLDFGSLAMDLGPGWGLSLASNSRTSTRHRSSSRLRGRAHHLHLHGGGDGEERVRRVQSARKTRSWASPGPRAVRHSASPKHASRGPPPPRLRANSHRTEVRRGREEGGVRVERVKKAAEGVGRDGGRRRPGGHARESKTRVPDQKTTPSTSRVVHTHVEQRWEGGSASFNSDLRGFKKLVTCFVANSTISLEVGFDR